MKKIYSGLLALLIFSCNNEKEAKENNAPYTDLFIYNLKGDVIKTEDSLFKVDSTGKILPDSIAYEYVEYKDGYLQQYTSIDSSGKNKTLSYYQHFENGLWKGLYSLTNGRLSDSMVIQLDSAGKYARGESFDSSRKLKEVIKDLQQNDYQQVAIGKVYNPEGRLTSSFASTFDKHLYTGGTNYDSAGKETSRVTIKLNDKGDPIEETRVQKVKDSTTTEVKKYRYDKYDETGNWTIRTELDQKDKPVKIIRKKLTYAKKED